MALANEFGSLEELLAADEERLQQVPDVGPVVAAPSTRSFTSRTTSKSSRRWSRPGFAGRQRAPRSRDQPLLGKTFVITGTLQYDDA